MRNNDVFHKSLTWRASALVLLCNNVVMHHRDQSDLIAFLKGFLYLFERRRLRALIGFRGVICMMHSLVVSIVPPHAQTSSASIVNSRFDDISWCVHSLIP